MTQQPRTPSTEAGQRMRYAIAENERLSLDGKRIAEYADSILAIETEARADLVAQIEKAVQREARNERSGVAAAALLRVVAIIRSAAAVEPSEW